MLIRPDGSLRYFTVREAARLQTFPDKYRFQGSWSEAMRQLGNAVPVRLAETVAGLSCRNTPKIELMTNVAITLATCNAAEETFGVVGGKRSGRTDATPSLSAPSNHR